jgi:retron-type reverse transcriptase
LKDFSHELAPPIAHLINIILETSIIPADFKIGKVLPIYKSGVKNQFNNYRPITILPIVSKIMERCIYDQLIKHLETNKLLSSRQFGFRKRRSTESAATLLLDDIHRAMDKSQLTGALFIDLSKAFDTISHSAILNKLQVTVSTSKIFN